MDSSGPSAEVEAVGAHDRDLEPGQKVGEYVVEEKIGSGGFGTVFRGAHPLIGKIVAIKVLKRQYSADPEMVSRFVAEARAVNQIRHRNIIDIFAFGHLDDGRHYYVMEYLDGLPLDEYIDSVGQMPLAEAIPLLRSLARALDAAHAKGIAHRDLKPENVFLATDPDGTVFPKLLDFGIAKLLAQAPGEAKHRTRTGAPIGTPYYMSPEQCRGRDVDHRTDIYAFGIVAYKLLTGEVPFDGEDYMEILLQQINDAPPPPSSKNPELPASVDAGVLWMLRKDPSERPPNLVTAVRGLEDAAQAAGIAVVAAAPSGVYSAETSRVGAQVTPSGVRPLPGRRSDLGSAATVDAKALTDSVIAAAGIKGGRRRLILALAAVGAIVVGVAVFFAVRSTRAPASPAVPAVPRPGPVAAGSRSASAGPSAGSGSGAATAGPSAGSGSASPGSAAAPTAPALVTIDVQGPPAGTEVYGPGGKLLGSAPGPVQLARSTRAVVLTLKADGYVTQSATVHPSADGAVDVTLHEKAAPHHRVPHRPHASSGSGSAGHAGSGRDSIEDPFAH
jgi:eukaryotic-like serine/threonine-protein kinase